MNEQERQRMIMKKRLEQKKLLREGKFDEAARLLGDGFKTDASLKNLMGENRQKYVHLYLRFLPHLQCPQSPTGFRNTRLTKTLCV